MYLSPKPLPGWLPASWLFVAMGWRGFWARLSTSDRAVAIFALVVAIVLPLSLIAHVVNMVEAFAPAGTGPVLGTIIFVLTGLLVIGGMIKVRGQKWFRFMPETAQNRQRREYLECAISSILGVVAVMLVTPFLKTSIHLVVISAACGIVLLGHFLILVVQLFLPNARAGHTNQMRLSHMTIRSRAAPFLQAMSHKIFPQTSSLFLRKANQNYLVWVLFIISLLALGGAAITFKSVLIGLSSLSSLILIVQLALMEPRVGNGPVIGAHSRNLPIKRARRDLIALLCPHLFCLLAALPFIMLEKSQVIVWTATASQLVLTGWLIWLFLVTGALPPHKLTPSFIWCAGGAMISSQAFPPLTPVWFAVMTLMLTRDLMRQSLDGPALWPK